MLEAFFYSLLGVLGAWVLFEVFEHAILPLCWLFFGRKPRLHHGPATLVGREAVVTRWEGSRGQVRVDGELWGATGPGGLATDQTVIVESMEKLTLRVSPADSSRAGGVVNPQA